MQNDKLPSRDQVRKFIMEKQKARQEYISHVTVFISVSAFLLLIWFVTGTGLFWPIFPIIGWGLVIVLHTFKYLSFNRNNTFDKTRRKQERIEQEIDREMARLRQRSENESNF